MLRKFIINLYNFFFNYSTPGNLTNVWNFGVISFIFLVTQIITGLLISLYYVPTEEFSFVFTESIMRDNSFGWIFRYLHSNGASLFFFFVYLHFFRGLYYFSFIRPKLLVWNVGVLLLVLMIVAAFTGYVLPWGQMSFWAATVITNLFSALPMFGNHVTIVLWGAYSVSTYTLNRFYTFHFILPFVILFFMILHFIFLHMVGSSNNIAVTYKQDKIIFHPYYTLKDLFVVVGVFVLYFLLVRYVPNYLSHSDNYIKADSLSTPEHIVPEWYFLAFYAILRSVPSKGWGIILLASSIIILFIFPFFVRMFYNGNIWSTEKLDLTFEGMYTYVWLTARSCPGFQKFLFWLFVADFIALSYLGMQPIEEPYLLAGMVCTTYYFMYFFSSMYIQSFQSWLDFIKKLLIDYDLYKGNVEKFIESPSNFLFKWFM